MEVAFVYDLRDDYRAMGWSEEALAEFDSAETVEAVAAALQRAGASVACIGHGRALAARLVAGQRWDLVFSIAEGASGRSREAQVPALCELFDQPYAFSDPLTMAATLDKAVAKRIVRDAGIVTAPFAVLDTVEAAQALDMAFPLFVKPVAEGTGKGCSLASRVTGRAALCTATADLLARFRQPVLVESFLPGREFTIGLLGTGAAAEVIAVLEVTVAQGGGATVYTFDDKEECETRVHYALATDAEARAAAAGAVAAYRILGCRDAARLDFRSDARGVPHFLEVNPIAGLHPTHSDLPILTRQSGRSYDWLIAGILHSAMQRYPRPVPLALAAG